MDLMTIDFETYCIKCPYYSGAECNKVCDSVESPSNKNLVYFCPNVLMLNKKLNDERRKKKWP